MRSTFLLACFGFAALTVFAAEHYLASDGPPSLRIMSVISPVHKPESLEITLELAATGKTPVAISQNHFGVRIGPLYPQFDTDVVFGTNSPHIFIAKPDKPVSLTFTVSTNGSHFLAYWTNLKPGRHTVKVLIGCDKGQHFDYEYMGQWHSDDCEFELK
jgi:hypothetical protein